jgi:hypothetical protein
VTASGPLPVVVPGARDRAIACRRPDLAAFDRAGMLALLDAHFDGVSPAQFHRDLDAKDWVLRIVRDDALVGFSTLRAWATTHAGRAIHVISSGDTIMSPDAWGSPALARGWIALVRSIQATQPSARWYWLLLSSGFRTYRFLPVFWRRFCPRHDAEPSPDEQDLLAALARAEYGDAYDEAAGVVRFKRPHRLRPHLAAIPARREDDPHVRFFLARNPGHARGDELVCLADIGDANLTAAGERMVRRGAP